MGRYDIPAESKYFIANAVRNGNIGAAVDLANRLIWDSLTRDPEGKRIPWMPLASEKRVNALLSCRPKILKSVPDDLRANLNFAAVMAALLGPQYREREWLPENLNLGLQMTPSAAVRTFGFCDRHYDQLNVFASSGYARLKINVCHNVDGSYPPCSLCEKLQDTIWTNDTIPELPYEHCTNSVGCRCLALADL
jgi:hypothetical protein